MTRTAGNFAGGDALTLMGVVHTAIDGHAAWEHVETITGSPSAGDEMRVYRCLGTANGYGTDFYLFLYYDDANPARLQANVAEQYNEATNEATNMVPFHTTKATGANAQYSGSNPYVITGGNTPMFTTSFYIEVPAVSCDYNISVTTKRVIIATNAINSQSALYLGLYDSFVQIANEFPICALNLSSAGTGQLNSSIFTHGGFTRHPGRISQANTNWHFTAMGPSAGTAMWTYYPRQFTNADAEKDLFLNGAVASRIMACLTYTADPSLYGFLRGLLYDVLSLRGEAAITVNDTFTFGTDVYDVIAINGAASNNDVLLLPQGV